MKAELWEVWRGDTVIGYTWATTEQVTEAREYGRSIGSPLVYLLWSTGEE